MGFHDDHFLSVHRLRFGVVEFGKRSVADAVAEIEAGIDVSVLILTYLDNVADGQRVTLIRDRMVCVEQFVNTLEADAVDVAVKNCFINARIDPAGFFENRVVAGKFGAVTVKIAVHLIDFDFHSIPPIP